MQVQGFNRKAILKEFPFIEKLPGHSLEQCDRLVVKVATERVMEAVPTQTKIYGPPLVNVNHGDKVFLYDGAGHYLGQVPPTVFTMDYTKPENEERVERGQSILDCVFENELDGVVQYAVWVHFGYEILNHKSTPTWEATIYKPSREPTIDEMVTEAMVQAIREVEALAAA